MERNYVFILREDMYDEWAWENGATNLICVSHNMYEVVDMLREYLKMELVEDENRIFGDYYGAREIDNIITNTIEQNECSFYINYFHINLPFQKNLLFLYLY